MFWVPLKSFFPVVCPFLCTLEIFAGPPLGGRRLFSFSFFSFAGVIVIVFRPSCVTTPAFFSDCHWREIQTGKLRFFIALRGKAYLLLYHHLTVFNCIVTCYYLFITDHSGSLEPKTPYYLTLLNVLYLPVCYLHLAHPWASPARLVFPLQALNKLSLSLSRRSLLAKFTVHYSLQLSFLCLQFKTTSITVPVRFVCSMCEQREASSRFLKENNSREIILQQLNNLAAELKRERKRRRGEEEVHTTVKPSSCIVC